MQRYVRGYRAGNNAGAVEVESILAGEQFDLSRMVQLGSPTSYVRSSKVLTTPGLALMNMGFKPVGRLVAEIGPKDLLYNLDSGPDRATLLTMQAQDPGGFDYADALYQLRVECALC